MKHILNVRGLEIGQGRPKIIIPVVESTTEAILNEIEEIVKENIHMIEWRADFYDEVDNLENLLEVLTLMRDMVGEKLLLFTLRTKREGGKKEISVEAYKKLLLFVAETGCVDFVDLEVFTPGLDARALIKEINSLGSLVVGSNHDFSRTPPKEDILETLISMQEYGVDIPKIAVMAKSKSDLLILLSATLEMHEKYAVKPLITMAMGPDGMLSRTTGEMFGSSMTFASLGSTSAPGQLPFDLLQESLENISSIEKLTK